MKKVSTLLILLSLTTSAFAEGLDNYVTDTESLWRTGEGAEDGTFNSISTSVFGWGLGLSAGIALLTAALHQSTAGHAHSSSD